MAHLNVTSLRMTDTVWTTWAKQTNGAPYTNTLKWPLMSYTSCAHFVRHVAIKASGWGRLWRHADRSRSPNEDPPWNLTTVVIKPREEEEEEEERKGEGRDRQFVVRPCDLLLLLFHLCSKIAVTAERSRSRQDWTTAPLNTPLRSGSALVFYPPLNSFHL